MVIQVNHERLDQLASDSNGGLLLPGRHGREYSLEIMFHLCDEQARVDQLDACDELASLSAVCPLRDLYEGFRRIGSVVRMTVGADPGRNVSGIQLVSLQAAIQASAVEVDPIAYSV